MAKKRALICLRNLLMKKFKLSVLLTAGLLSAGVAPAFSANLTVEELRIPKASKAMPNVINAFDNELTIFTKQLSVSSSFKTARQLVDKEGLELWQLAKARIKSAKNFDDRPLFWGRLQYSKLIREVKPAFDLSEAERTALLVQLEQSSRGRTELSYSQGTTKKILVTGFDPFLLDRNIDQSNPSGVAAMLLDGKVVEHNGIKAEINAVMIPVRYEDFDQGLIEEVLAPYYATNSVDMIVTISMGRKDFDLERFPGKRRSVTAPDNLNVLSGGTKTAPIISKLNQMALPGTELVEFSLPVSAMQQAKGPYKVIDNHKVTTLTQTFHPKTLSQLTGDTAVAGSGGGYLSNEISYRSIRLRNELNSAIPTGHIHTPRIKQYQPAIEKAIVEQIEEMLKLSLTEI